MIFKKIRIYLFAAALLFAFTAGGTIVHWYHKAKETSALKTVIKESDKLTKKSEKTIAKATEEKEKVRIVYKTIYKKVSNVKTTCTYPPGSEFIRLYNEANKGSSTTNAH